MKEIIALNPTMPIAVITTGGTIEKTYDEFDGTLANRQHVIKQQIEDNLRLPYTELIVKSILNMDSLDMKSEHREKIKEAIEIFNQSEVPVVVLHGTDTMQETAELVAEQLKVSIPVIFTGAMLPFALKNSDALQNLTEALMALRLVSKGVYISFHNRLFKVPGARKNKALRTFERYRP